MDPCKIAFITEALEGFNVTELRFLEGFIHAKLHRISVTTARSAQVTSIAPAQQVEQNVVVTQTAEKDEAAMKKTVRWSDIVSTTPTSPAAAKQDAKVFVKTPQPSRIQMKKTPSSTTPSTSQRKKSVDRNSPASQPRADPYTGREWKGFCGKENHECIYTFRDHCNAVNIDGKPIPKDQDAGDATWSEDLLDGVRFDCGRIYDNQLYLRGWNPDLVNWET
ncbi:unnamed protein product, partial [marine sediment metagenome]